MGKFKTYDYRQKVLLPVWLEDQPACIHHLLDYYRLIIIMLFLARSRTENFFGIRLGPPLE
jgi:hypothetical protein